MILRELAGRYKYIYYNWKRQNSNRDSETAAYNAGKDICLKYEVPADKENQGIKRGNTAKDLYNIMKK